MLLKILNTNHELQAIIDNYWGDTITEGINREYTFTFSAVIDEEKSPYIVINNIVEIDDNYFRIVYVKKERTSDGSLIISVDCYQVAMFLNLPDYNLEFFASVGTPAIILAEILAGTPYTVGAVEFADPLTLFSIQEESSRRGILMQFADLLGGEYKFDKYVVSLLQRRGADNGNQLRVGKNMLGVTKHTDMRSGTLETAFDVDMIELRNVPGYEEFEVIELGDDVKIIDPDLDVDEKQRIVDYSYSPRLRQNSKLVIANHIAGIEDTITSIQRDTVYKERLYNGVKVGPENGFEATASDYSVKSTLNATRGIAIDLGDGTGDVWTPVFYVEIVDGEPRLFLAGNAIFSGRVEASEFVGGSINIGNGNFLVNTAGIMDAVGARIRSAAGYPRVSLNSDNNLIGAYADADTYTAFNPQYGGVPSLVFVDDGTIKAFINRSLGITTLGTFDGEHLNLQASGNLRIDGTSGVTGSFFVADAPGGPTDMQVTFRKGIRTS